APTTKPWPFETVSGAPTGAASWACVDPPSKARNIARSAVDQAGHRTRHAVREVDGDAKLRSLSNRCSKEGLSVGMPRQAARKHTICRQFAQLPSGAVRRPSGVFFTSPQ